MDKNYTAASTGGIGFTGILTIVFIVLKLTGFINWSWVWVLSPLWISMVLTAVILLVAMLLIYISNNKRDWGRHRWLDR